MEPCCVISALDCLMLPSCPLRRHAAPILANAPSAAAISHPDKHGRPRPLSSSPPRNDNLAENRVWKCNARTAEKMAHAPSSYHFSLSVSPDAGRDGRYGEHTVRQKESGQERVRAARRMAGFLHVLAKTSFLVDFTSYLEPPCMDVLISAFPQCDQRRCNRRAITDRSSNTSLGELVDRTDYLRLPPPCSLRRRPLKRGTRRVQNGAP